MILCRANGFLIHGVENQATFDLLAGQLHKGMGAADGISKANRYVLRAAMLQQNSSKNHPS